MGKKVDWNQTYRPPQRKLGGQYSSAKEMFAKAAEREIERQRAQENLQKAMPAFEALLKCRLSNGTALRVMRPIRYQTSELQKHMMGDEMRGGKFQDVVKVLEPGTEMVLKSIDNTMQEFIFQGTDGEEIVLPFTVKKELMMQTNVYEDTIKFIEDTKGE